MYCTRKLLQKVLLTILFVEALLDLNRFNTVLKDLKRENKQHKKKSKLYKETFRIRTVMLAGFGFNKWIIVS